MSSTVVSLTPKSVEDYENDGSLPRSTSTSDDIAALDRATQVESVTEWTKQRQINLVHVKVGKAKDGALPFTPATVKQVLELLMVRDNYPIYLHDLDGSDVLSMMCAALRKLQGWSERAWLEEMSRYLRQPPPEPEHLTFLRRLLSPALPQSDPPVIVIVPAPSKRVPWLWPQGLPTLVSASGKKGTQHWSMRVKVLEEEKPAPPTKTAEKIINGDKRANEGMRASDEPGGSSTERLSTLGGDQAKAMSREASTSRASFTSTGSDSTLRPILGDRDMLSGANSSRRQSLVLDENDESRSNSSDGRSSRQHSFDTMRIDEHEDDEDDGDDDLWDEDEDDVPVLSQTIEALDLG
ncbi:protein-tyrosine phosphatase [Microbotryomycetes sp. JL221]|nr:protein-tyrosine phosphatase [Microbotryomycetes sp. JL221]